MISPTCLCGGYSSNIEIIRSSLRMTVKKNRKHTHTTVKTCHTDMLQSSFTLCPLVLVYIDMIYYAFGVDVTVADGVVDVAEVAAVIAAVREVLASVSDAVNGTS